MSAVVIPAATAFELEALLTEWALKIPVSMLGSLRHVLSHLAIVLLVTGLCSPIHDGKSRSYILLDRSFHPLDTLGRRNLPGVSLLYSI